MPPSATVDCGPSSLQPKSNLVEEPLQHISHLNNKPAQVVDIVTSKSSFVHNSVGPGLRLVADNALSKGPTGSTGVVDSTFGALPQVKV